jgi:hypothetical protein
VVEEIVMSESNLTLEAVGREYRLTRFYPDGTKTEILLSEDNISSLALSAQRMKDHIIARYKAGGVSVEPVIPVRKVGLSTDMHHTELHIDIIPEGGRQSLIFSFSAVAARVLLNTLAEWVAKIEHAKPISH